MINDCQSSVILDEGVFSTKNDLTKKLIRMIAFNEKENFQKTFPDWIAENWNNEINELFNYNHEELMKVIFHFKYKEPSYEKMALAIIVDAAYTQDWPLPVNIRGFLTGIL